MERTDERCALVTAFVYVWVCTVKVDHQLHLKELTVAVSFKKDVPPEGFGSRIAKLSGDEGSAFGAVVEKRPQVRTAKLCSKTAKTLRAPFRWIWQGTGSRCIRPVGTRSALLEIWSDGRLNTFCRCTARNTPGKTEPGRH